MLPEIRLTTERLTLRTPIEDDFPAVAAFMASPRSSFVGGPMEGEFDRWRSFLGAAGHWALKGYGMFVVLHGDRRVGRVGIIDHLGWDEPELGWQLFDGCEGQGYAFEAAVAARRWASEVHGLGPLISYIAPTNDRSRAVAVRLGARHERDGTLMDFPVQIWRHPAGDAAA